MAKLANAIDALNSINQNTSDTKNMLSAMLAQDKAQDERARKDKILEDKDDKKSVVERIGGSLLSPVKKAGDGFLDMLGDFAKGLLGIAGLQFLMDPRFQNALNNFIEKTKSFFEWIASLDKVIGGSIGTMLGFTAAIKALQAAMSPVKTVKRVITGSGRGGVVEAPGARAEAERIRAEQERAKQLEKDAAAKRKLQDQIRNAERGQAAKLAEQEKARMRANAAADKFDPRTVDAEQKLKFKRLATEAPVKTKMGDIAFNENTQRYQKVTPKGWGAMVKTDDAIAAISNAEAEKAPKPKPADVEKPAKPAPAPALKPDDSFARRMLNRGVSTATKALVVADAIGGSADTIRAKEAAGETVRTADWVAGGVAGVLTTGVGLLESAVNILADVAEAPLTKAKKMVGTYNPDTEGERLNLHRPMRLALAKDLADTAAGVGIGAGEASPITTTSIKAADTAITAVTNTIVTGALNALEKIKPDFNFASSKPNDGGYGVYESVGMPPVVQQNNNYGQYMMAPQTSVRTPLD